MFDSCLYCRYTLNFPPRSATSVNWQNRSLSTFTDGGRQGRGAGGGGEKWGVQCHPTVFSEGLKNRKGGQRKQTWSGGPSGALLADAPAARTLPPLGDLELLGLHRALRLWFTPASTVERHCSTYMRTSEKIKCYIYLWLLFLLRILIKYNNFCWVVPAAPRCLPCPGWVLS